MVVFQEFLTAYNDPSVQLGVRGKLEGQIKGKKQENAKWSREVATLEKKMREKEVEMNQTKPLYIKAKEKTSHVAKRLEANKYVAITYHLNMVHSIHTLR